MPPRPNQQRRDELLNQLESVMLEEGFAHLRVGVLTIRLHCTRSTLYKLAPSIDELYALVFERFVDKALSDACAQGDAMDRPADALIMYAYVIGRWVRRGSDSFWRDVRDNPVVVDVLSAARATGYLEMKRYMDEGVAAGVFRPANTAFLAHVVWLASAASRDPDLMQRLGLTSDQALSEIGHLIVHGMLPCAAPIHGDCLEV
jgi:AcrR family transcriptional regulator